MVDHIILSEYDKIILHNKGLCMIFNAYFVNVAKDIGEVVASVL